MGRFAGLRSVQGRWAEPGRPTAAATCFACAAGSGHQSSFLGDYALPEHDCGKAATSLPRQPGDGAKEQETAALECAADRGARKQGLGRDWLPHLEVTLPGHVV